MTGGYLIPATIRVKRKGIKALIARLFIRDSGWEYVNLHERILNYVKNKKMVL